MRITASAQQPPPQPISWEERMEGPDKSLINCWLRGREKALEVSALAAAAIAGELPILPFKGGIARAIKTKTKIGAHQYLAMWQGLRGEDLDITQGAEVRLTCSKTGVIVTFTDDYTKFKDADE